MRHHGDDWNGNGQRVKDSQWVWKDHYGRRRFLVRECCSLPLYLVLSRTDTVLEGMRKSRAHGLAIIVWRDRTARYSVASN